ncbi:hypothetical protein LCL89_13970 [Halobacillus yeomjeoni]|uniref:hypothetical protein n=1 Tax=Halobacillus yeomjeoni TaxID=311194 RepID=UPI001CD785E3|nr:hypothetical protein [Halobacillus yeomjeoni]MCA0985134.1 hypothetical protein [Halobacillus yeomjeoni]
MTWIWGTFAGGLFFYFLIKPLFFEEPSLAILFITLHSIVMLLILTRYQMTLSLLLIAGFLTRMCFLLWDIYGRHIYELPHSGTDTEGYLASGMQIAGDLSLLTSDIYGGLYSKVLGVLFFLGPEDRIMGHYLNVLIGMTTLLLVLKILKEWNIKSVVQNYCVAGMAFFPSALIFSSILLREALISMLVVLSFYCFMQWYQSLRLFYMGAAVAIVLIGSVLHSGVIGILVGYAFLFIFYNHEEKKLVFSVRSVVPFLVIVMAALSMSVVSMKNIPFLGKFAFYMENSQDLYKIASGNDSTDAGGSAYLTSLNIDTLWEVVLYAPIKMFYFLTSPLPWGWRGFSDAASFSYDGLIYFVLLILVVIKFRDQVMNQPILLGLLVMILTTVFIFGIGVDNAGTSMRHRYKLVYLVAMLAVFVIDQMMKGKEDRNTG